MNGSRPDLLSRDRASDKKLVRSPVFWFVLLVLIAVDV